MARSKVARDAQSRRRARRVFLYGLTRRRIGNDNDPVFESAPVFLFGAPDSSDSRLSPGLRTRMVLRGRLSQIGALPGLRITKGMWGVGRDLRQTAGVGTAERSNVIPFRAWQARAVKAAVGLGGSVVVSARGRVVSLVTDDMELALTPVQARSLAVSLFDVANDTERRS